MTSGSLPKDSRRPKLAPTITAGYRLFSAPDFEAVCTRARANAVTRLRASPGRVRMRAGQEFEPRGLKIEALDAHGALLPNVPIAIEIEAYSNLVDLSIADGAIRPLAPGTLRIRVHTICGTKVVELFVMASIFP